MGRQPRQLSQQLGHLQEQLVGELLDPLRRWQVDKPPGLLPWRLLVQ